MEFSHILLDFDNTLVDFSFSAYTALQATFQFYQIEWTEEHYQQYKHINHELWSEFEKGKITTEDIRKKRFSLFLESIGMRDIDGYEVNAFYLEQIVENPKTLDGTIESLDILNECYTLGIVTNGLKEVQRRRIANHGLEHYFDHIFVSDEINLAKPDTRYFQHVYDRIDIDNKSSALVVGDNIISDIGGAQSFGFNACWFNPDMKENPTSILPKYTIQGLQDLVNLLSQD